MVGGCNWVMVMVGDGRDGDASIYMMVMVTRDDDVDDGAGMMMVMMA